MDAERVVVRLTRSALREIHGMIAEREDRSDFLREAAELEIAIRRLDIYPALMGNLTANETFTDFCAKAVRQAVLKRVAALSDMEEIDPRMSTNREE
jgi:hypothetical protein